MLLLIKIFCFLLVSSMILGLFVVMPKGWGERKKQIKEQEESGGGIIYD